MPGANAVRPFLALVALVFVAVGVYNLFYPVEGMAIFGLQLTSASALNEMRANYGGMHLFMGLFFLSGALLEQTRRSALLVVALFTGGLTLGRLVSLQQDGSPNPFVWAFLIVEAAACLFAVWLLITTRRG
jgi:hypothetical protein